MNQLTGTTFPFAPRQRDFTLDNALGCALAAHLAYEKELKNVKERMESWGFTEPDPIEHGSSWGLLFSNAEMELLAFRGTDDFKDMGKNSKAYWTESPYGPVHAGFMGAANDLLPQVTERLAGMSGDSPKSLWLTGHSLGGSIALLTAITLYEKYNLDVAGVYTFGQPAIGGRKFQKIFREKFKPNYFRIVYQLDSVPKLIVPVLMNAHVGVLKHIDSKDRLWSGKVPFRVKLRDQTLGQRSNPKGSVPGFGQHDKTEYIHAVQRQIDAAGAM